MLTRRLLALIGALVPLSPLLAQPDLDVCSLIPRAEIEEVQREAVTDTKSSAPVRPGVAAVQCFYTVATFARSVSLEVTRSDLKRPPGGGARDQWNEMFHPEARASGTTRRGEAGREGRIEREKESSPPLPVKDVGDEAFWRGNAITGGLYVLIGDAYIRISIGGSEDRSIKLEKATALARKAIARL